MLRVGILAAGGGTNLQAIIDAVESRKITDVELCFVLSNKPGVRALERARTHGIKPIVVDMKSYADRAEFEKMLIRSGIILIKYWFSVSDEEQEKRFQQRMDDITRRWKLSPMDLESRKRWVEYSRAKDDMFRFTDTKQSPWYVVQADDKKRARLNCISHLLTLIPYEDLTPPKMELPPKQVDDSYVRPPFEDQTFVPEYVIEEEKKK